ncbi:hypothetical protein CVU75_00690 [Candidatus Dependentiae bacterium HGW-Dependentiae-1]|nr:MAG: hypothetical protein CVU75_00690 [Candidatus Dependentiae bacterium HGW-Dependentiae-1]
MLIKKMVLAGILFLVCPVCCQGICVRSFLAGVGTATSLAYCAHWYHTKPGYREPAQEKMHIVTFCPVPAHTVKKVTRMRTLVSRLRTGKNIPEQSIIRIQKNNGTGCAYCSVHNGIVVSGSAEQLFLYTNGNRLSSSTLIGAGAVSVYGRSKASVIPPVPCVTFDHLDDNYRYFDLGRTAELSLVYTEIKHRYPHAQITLVGECGGALRMLRYAAENPDDTTRVIVAFSPMPELNSVVQGIYDSFVKRSQAHYLISAAFVKKTLLYLFPSYSIENDNLLAVAHKIAGKKIFIGYHRRDIIIPNSYMERLVNELIKHNEVYFLVVDGPELIPHDSIENHNVHIQLAVNAFYRKCGLPYDAALAEKGVQFLESAAAWAQYPAQGFAHACMPDELKHTTPL